MLSDRFSSFTSFVRLAKQQGLYPYFRPISHSWGTEVKVEGRRLIMVASNDYLGLSHDPRVKEAVDRATRRWGTGPGGSRFLCGNTTLLEELENRLAAFVGKKKAVVHVTGFSTNLGAIACLLTPRDLLLCDRENHASIFQGWRASRARLVSFPHNDAGAAASKLKNILEGRPPEAVMLITEGVFSMSGDLAALPELVKLKEVYPRLIFYLDDAHGLGTMGPGGKGTASHFGLSDQVDFIMGTFSKALASIGGFIAGDDLEVLDYLRHQSSPLIFSAALPAGNTAAVLAVMDIIAQEPERGARLWENARRAVAGYREIGLTIKNSQSPIIPIIIGDEVKAGVFAKELFEEGIFALPSIYPAVPRGQALIRTVFMSTHTPSQVDRVIEVLAKLAPKHHLPVGEQEPLQPLPAQESSPAAPASLLSSALKRSWSK